VPYYNSYRFCLTTSISILHYKIELISNYVGRTNYNMTYIKRINRSKPHKRHTLIQDEIKKKKKWKRETDKRELQESLAYSSDLANHHKRLLGLIRQNAPIKKISREVFYPYIHTNKVLHRVFNGGFLDIRRRVLEFIGMENYNRDSLCQRKLIDHCVEHPWCINTRTLSIMEVLIKSGIDLSITRNTIWYKNYSTHGAPAWMSMRRYDIMEGLNWLLRTDTFKLWSYYRNKTSYGSSWSQPGHEEVYDPKPSGCYLQTEYVTEVQKRLCSRLKKMVVAATIKNTER